MHIQYHGYARSQGISIHCVDLDVPEHSSINNWRVKYIPCHRLPWPQAPLSPSNWSALCRGRGSPVMSWILLKANNGQQASRVGDERFFRFKRNVQHLWTAITRHHVDGITHQQVMRLNQWSNPPGPQASVNCYGSMTLATTNTIYGKRDPAHVDMWGTSYQNMKYPGWSTSLHCAGA